MRKIMILMSLIGLAKASSSQVIVNLQLPQVGLNLKTQLWNMTLTNTGSSTVTIKINLMLTDNSNSQQVLAGTTNLMQLPQGTKVIQYNDVIPVNYTVLNNNYNIDASPGGFLPIGNFDVCFEVLKQNIEVFETMVEECTTIQVDPASPPFLNTPDDLAEIDNRRPLFTWFPPSPASLFSNLSYELKLVEVSTGQSGTDAIEQNIPVIVQQNILGTIFQYPASSNELDTGKTYAWQVTANNNGVFVAKTEVWTFKEIIFGSDNIVYVQNAPYFKLKKDVSSANFLCDGILKFEYTNETNDSMAAIRILDITNKDRRVMNLADNFVHLKYGQNLLQIDLLSNGGFTSGHIYLLELINSRNETWTGKFGYKPTE